MKGKILWNDYISVSTVILLHNLPEKKFYQDKKLNSALDILMSATETDQLTESEHIMLCLEILSGQKKITGIYPGDDYGVVDDSLSKDYSLILNTLDKIREDKNTLETENKQLLRKFLFMCDYMYEHGYEHTLSSISRRYKDEYDEPFFDDPQATNTLSYYEGNVYNKSNSMLESFLEQQRENQKEHTYEPYGWIEPDGTYHPVDWGEHAKWAQEYLEENYPYKEYHAMYWKEQADGTRKNYVNGDMLVYCLGWVLLDSPVQAQARPTFDRIKGLTKAQKEFLYDYYMDYNRPEDANKLYKEDEVII